MNISDLNSSLSSREIDDDHQEWIPSLKNEREGSAGRFRAPISFTDRLIERLERTIREILAIRNNTHLLNNDPYRLSPDWQCILDYLYINGLIRSKKIFLRHQFHDTPKLFVAALNGLSDPSLTDGMTSRLHSGGAASPDFIETLSKSIGEFLERYSFTLYQRKDFLHSSAKNLQLANKKHLDIFKLAGFADWQKKRFPERQFDETSNFFWVKGRELLSNTQILIPAQLVFWNYNVYQEPKEPFLRGPNTNGMAGHFTKEEAVLAGIYENIQRDAFLIFWLNRIAPPKINLNTIKDRALQELIQKNKRYYFETVLLNTTLDFQVPSCVCVLINQTDIGPKLVMGGGCEPNLERALSASINEAMSVYFSLRDTKSVFTLPDNYIPFMSSDINREKRLLLGGNRNMFSRFKWFVSGQEQSLAETQNKFPLSFPTPREELQYMLEIFKNKKSGYEVFTYEATHEILKTLGYHTTHVVIPTLIPLYLKECNAPLGALRLREVPRRFGYKVSQEFNPLPHPFP